jgi:hypothetical protein
MLSTLILIAALGGNAEPATASMQREPLPSEFRHDRVFVVPEIKGRRIAFYTDTGGGWNAIRRGLVEPLGLTIESVEADGSSMDMTAFPGFDTGSGIPDAPRYMRGRLSVADDDQLKHWGDGFLGGRWFADRVWEFDYPRRRLHLLTSWTPPKKSSHRLSLGFHTDANGARTMHFPSMRVQVDGEDLDMLLDTGATATLSDSAAPTFGLEPGTAIGTSFIIHSVFVRWTERHPDWRVLDAADAIGGNRMRMIEVPEIVIAGHRVGPVWFAERPDNAFRKYMASMMDRPTSGAIGGSAFRYLRMIVDYPGAAAYFYRDAAKPGLD